ncbi:MAG: EamA family transporter [Limnobacter sp.]|nr:EamA family transporter [Limnobacter sp.]
MTPLALGLVLGGVALNALAQFLLKMATNRVGIIEAGSAASLSALTGIFWQWPMIVGLAAYGVSLLVWLMALSRTDVSLAYPMLSLGYVFNALAAQHFLGEAVSVQRWIAIGVILLGVALLARS